LQRRHLDVLLALCADLCGIDEVLGLRIDRLQRLLLLLRVLGDVLGWRIDPLQRLLLLLRVLGVIFRMRIDPLCPDLSDSS
jgi:hypothetical protein